MTFDKVLPLAPARSTHHEMADAHCEGVIAIIRGFHRDRGGVFSRGFTVRPLRMRPDRLTSENALNDPGPVGSQWTFCTA